MHLTDNQSREIAAIALNNLREQQVTLAESPRELARENPFQFINEICKVTLEMYASNEPSIK